MGLFILKWGGIMRIFALELDNEIKGLEKRKKYIESLIAKLQQPDLVVLPELSLPSYLGNKEVWKYADLNSQDTSLWAKTMATKYHTYIGVGYLETDGTDYYNSYLIADKDQVYGIVRKCEGEAYIFKRGDFNHIITTPFGNVAVGICYDARRKHLYNQIKNREVSLILFPHGSPADPKKCNQEQQINNYFCKAYLEAFRVPVVYVNSVGKLDLMLGMTGKLMAKSKFKLSGLSKIYYDCGDVLNCEFQEGIGVEVSIKCQKRIGDIRFYGEDINKGNFLFRKIILKNDIRKGILFYERNKRC